MVDAKEMPLETLQAYKVLCEFGSVFLLENPSSESINQLIDRRELFREEPFVSVAPDASNVLYGVLEAAEQAGREEFIAALRCNYTYLFYMVAASQTSPFESVYRTEDHTMFGPSTLDVRALYQKWGMQLPAQGKVPDDHLGYELSFLANLLDKAILHRQENSSKQPGNFALDALSGVTQFLSEHTLVFGPTYLKKVKMRSQEPFYTAVSDIIYHTLSSMASCFDAQAIEQIIESDFLLEK